MKMEYRRISLNWPPLILSMINSYETFHANAYLYFDFIKNDQFIGILRSTGLRKHTSFLKIYWKILSFILNEFIIEYIIEYSLNTNKAFLSICCVQIDDDSNDESISSSKSNFEIIKKSKYSFKDFGGYDKIKKELDKQKNQTEVLRKQLKLKETYTYTCI